MLKREERRRRRDNKKASKKLCKGGKKNLQLQSKTQLFPKEFYIQEPSNCKTPSASAATNISSQDEALKEPILENPSELEKGEGEGGGSS